MSDDIKKQLGAVIDSYKEDLCQMSDEIFDLAEISGEEIGRASCRERV